jgi:hypothetical protein
MNSTAVSPELLEVLNAMADALSEISDALPSGEYGRTYRQQRAEEKISVVYTLIEQLQSNNSSEK